MGFHCSRYFFTCAATPQRRGRAVSTVRTNNTGEPVIDRLSVEAGNSPEVQPCAVPWRIRLQPVTGDQSGLSSKRTSPSSREGVVGSEEFRSPADVGDGTP